MAEQERTRPAVQVQLSVREGRAAIEFYKTAFDATELFRFGGDRTNDEVVAQLAVGDGIFWVEDESPANSNFSPQSLGGATERMLLIVDDPHSFVEQAKKAGATEILPVGEEHGWLLGRVADPFGHHWEIGKPLIEWPPHPAEGGQPEANQRP